MRSCPGAPEPPVARLTGRRIVDASLGSATYTLPAPDWMLGPRGVHSGVLAVLADGALIGSVISGFPPVFSSHTHPTSHAAPSTPRARV